MQNEEAIRTAQQKMDDAVEEYFQALGCDENTTLTNWALVAHHARFDESGHAASSYQVVYMGGMMPDHIAVGLFHMAIDTIRGITRYRFAT